jgi:hypothetical protein
VIRTIIINGFINLQTLISIFKKSITAAKKSNIAAAKISIAIKPSIIKQKYYNDNVQSPIISFSIFFFGLASTPIRFNKHKFSIFAKIENNENASDGEEYK